MTILELKNKKTKHDSLTKGQTAFNRNRRKLDQLYAQLDVEKNACEEALGLYHSRLKPRQGEAGKLIVQFLLKLVEVAPNRDSFAKQERAFLEEIIKDSLDEVVLILPYQELPLRIIKLYEEVYGESIAEQFNREKEKFKEFLKEAEGLDNVDLSAINMNDNFEEIMVKVAQSVHQSMGENKESPPEKQKSAKQLQNEKRAEELEIIKGKKLNHLYKRLVKVLHPDLEQDPKMRAEKESLMKQLTVAYEKQDLLSLLAFESQWLDGALDVTNEETLKAYNAIFKQQIEGLKREIEFCYMDPRYLALHHYIRHGERPLEAIYNELAKYETMVEDFTKRIEDLSGANPLKKLKQILADSVRETEDEFVDFMESLFMDFSAPRTKRKKATRN